MKTCTKCRVARPHCDFWRDRTRSDGRFPQCKPCQKNRPIDREANRQRSAAWRAANPQRARAGVAAWKERNRDRVYASIHRRLARKYASRGGRYTTAAKLRARLDFFGGRCHYCGEVGNVIEHRIPLSRGGPHLPANIVLACDGCNNRKHTKTEREFAAIRSTHTLQLAGNTT